MAFLEVPASPETYTAGRGGRPVRWVVVHYTGAPGSARDNGAYFAGGNRGASAHYFVDDDDTVLSVGEADTAWAVGNFEANQESISVEVCSDGEDFSAAEVERLRALVRGLMARHGVDAGHVIRHRDVADHYAGRFVDPRKDCPAPYVSGDPDGSKWAALHGYITREEGEDEMNEAQNAALMELARTDDPTGRGAEGCNLYARVCYLGAKTDALTRTDDPTGRGAEGVDLYGRVCHLGAKADRLLEAVGALAAKVDALAKG